MLAQGLLCNCLGAVESARLVLSSQRMWHKVEGDKMPARDPLPSVDVTSALAGSLPTGISWKDPLQQPQCSLTARKYFRSQQILDIFNGAGRF